MTDISTGLQILGASIGSIKLLEKLLGPTADYIGEGIKLLTKKRIDAFKRIFEKAVRKLDDDDLEKEGSVNPRILKEIIHEGTYVENELTEEYYAGVLASSRKGIVSDDRGVIYLKRLENLSSFQIRAHYIFYALFKEYLNGESYLMTNYPQETPHLFIDYENFINSMNIHIPNDIVRVNEGGLGFKFADDILIHCVFGLLSENLLKIFTTGSKYRLSNDYDGIKGNGLVVCPSPLGTELFLWCNGLGHINVNDFLRTDILINPLDEVELPVSHLVMKKTKV